MISLLQVQKFRGKTGDNMADKNYLHTAYANSADGTDGFTTVYPNLNLLVNSSAKTKDGFFKNFDKVENGYGEVTMKGTNTWVTKDLGDGFSIQPRNYKPGDKYTMSMDVMFTSWNLPAGTTIPEVWLGQRYFGGSGKRICSIDLPKDPSKMLNQWIRITQTSTIPPYDDPSVNTQSIFTVGFFGLSEGSFTIRIRKPKQEPGTIATPHMPSASKVTTADWPKFVGTYVDTNPVSSAEPSKYDWDEMKYRVYLDGTPVGGSKLLSFDLENLKAGTSYNVQVSQINGNVESDKSESVAFKTTLPK